DEGGVLNFSIDNWEEGDKSTLGAWIHCPAGADREELRKKTPADIFDLFVTEDYKSVADETNRYAVDYLATGTAQLKEHSRFRSGVQTTWQEMKVSVAMIIAMALVVQLDFSKHWTTTKEILVGDVPLSVNKEEEEFIQHADHSYTRLPSALKEMHTAACQTDTSPDDITSLKKKIE
ncbi:hypothetical protein BaRGS_00013317, partial [Batillaria attramentaria]